MNFYLLFSFNNSKTITLIYYLANADKLLSQKTLKLKLNYFNKNILNYKKQIISKYNFARYHSNRSRVLAGYVYVMHLEEV